MAKRGIDISAHQGDINLEALKSEIDFVIIRVGYGTKGTIDTKFERNVNECIRLGIPFGFYWYSYALNTTDARREAVHFINATEKYRTQMSYGAWFDMEDADGYKKKNGMPSNEELRKMCAAFCEVVENSGYYTGIYASESWFKNQLNGDEIKRFDKWVAQWPTSGNKQKGLSVNADSRNGLSLWQFTSEGKFKGYNGRLDTNYAYHDFPNPSVSSDVSEPIPAPASTPEPQNTQKYAIGSVVVINGPLYTSATAASPAGNVSNKTTKITRYVAGTPHPYNTTGDLGWMDESNISPAQPAPVVDNTIYKGTKVKFTGTKSYSGMNLASWTHNAVFDVIEVSGDRIVIGKGTAVTAAVNARDCQKI